MLQDFDETVASPLFKRALSLYDDAVTVLRWLQVSRINDEVSFKLPFAFARQSYWLSIVSKKKTSPLLQAKGSPLQCVPRVSIASQIVVVPQLNSIFKARQK